MNLTIDIGNTRTKIALFNNNSIVEQRIYKALTLSEIEILFKLNTGIDKCILSNVANPSPELINYCRKAFGTFIELSWTTPVPFTNLYTSKATQGSDRIAAVAGAMSIFPGSDILIVDAGTTITYDFIDSTGFYKGGNISPGIDLRFRSLHENTRKLPLIVKDEVFKDNLLGENTEEAIKSGVQNGIVFEIEGYISTVKQKYRAVKIIITGGDAQFLAGKFKNIIFAEPNLVMIGLNRILEYNVEI